MNNETVAIRIETSKETRMSPTDQKIHDRRWWTLAILSLSLLVISLDNTILNVGLPTIDRDLHATASQLQWIVDAYMLVFAGLLLTAGSLGDRLGRRKALFTGLAVFGLGSLASAMSGSAGMLIASRALMGVGAAAVMPSTLSILTNVFPSGERGKAIGIWAAVAGLGIAIGPVAGGWLIEHASWHWIFLVNLPFVVAALAAGSVLVPESKDPDASPLDPIGAGLSMAGLTSLLWAIIEAPSRGWTDGLILGAFGMAVVLLSMFVVWERRSDHPMLDVKLFRNPRFSAASVSITLVFFSLMGMIFFLTQYLQYVLQYDPLEAGIRIAAVAIGMILGGPLSARLTEKLGTKVMVATGLTLVAGGLMLFSGVGEDTSYGIVFTALVVMGFGMASAMAPATDSIMGSLPLARASVGSAVNDTTRMVGGALGVAVLGSLLSSGYGAHMDGAVSQLPAGAASIAHDQLGGALLVSQHIGGQAGQALAEAARTAFLSGMHTAAIVAAGVALTGALLAALFLPARAESKERREAVDPRLERVPA
jgi:EmrB/QacA subfamily drug resistance transporter